MDEQALTAFFNNIRRTLENAYLAHSEPWRQSGMSGPQERWNRLRKPIADCIDRSGSFLDIGCANGYLLECILRWTAERELKIEPYGVDISERLLALAKTRLPLHKDHFYHANACFWKPPRRFDFVRTELVYVPGELEREYVHRLLEEFVAPGGKLLIANYAENEPDPARGLLPGCEPTRHILERLAVLGFTVENYRDGYDPTKDRWTRVAILEKKR
jgi:SAM-dependent methyltransferase